MKWARFRLENSCDGTGVKGLMFIIYGEPMIDRLSTGVTFLASRLRRYHLMYYTMGQVAYLKLQQEKFKEQR